MKLLCDQMLGSLAKWLRIYGFDTYFAERTVDDSELINIAKKEGRVLITRDKELVYNAKRENVKVIKIETTDLEEQKEQIITIIKPKSLNYLSRCLLCNSLLEEISKNEVKNKVPEKIFENNEEFLYCKKCNKIYWKGTHYENMLSKINQKNLS
mgnify:CR=1 FL=1